MTIGGGTRSMGARLARLERATVEPRGPIDFRLLFSDGRPVFPREGEDPNVPVEIPEGAREIRMASVDGVGPQSWPGSRMESAGAVARPSDARRQRRRRES